MSADLLDELLAGHVAPVRIALVAPTPAKAANPANREHPCGPAADSNPCEDLRISAKAEKGTVGAGPDSQTFAAVRRPQNGPRGEQTRGSSQVSQDSQGYPTTCAAAGVDDLAAVAWTDGDIARFEDRRARLMRWGWSEAEAEKLAERLVRRDREGDDRVSCADCRHYRAGRCGNHISAGLWAPDVGRDLAGMLQRCPGFQTTR